MTCDQRSSVDVCMQVAGLVFMQQSWFVPPCKFCNTHRQRASDRLHTHNSLARSK